jgi:2-polyprenyl-3-methyl-5-hydroxy-6-metoxy-1,4-benzoquinol methylase
MNSPAHWETIHKEKSPNAVSWYRPHLETSLTLIEQAANPSASIIDIGGGQSTLVDDLLARGYKNLTVLDISQAAIDANRKRLADTSDRIHWLVADITKTELAPGAYDVWHDRAVFHFLTAPSDRTAYIRQLTTAIKPRGQVILSTFGPDGPTKCSGLDIVRYNADSLQRELGERFRLRASSTELHHTPTGATQQFFYCHFTLHRPAHRSCDLLAPTEP